MQRTFSLSSWNLTACAVLALSAAFLLPQGAWALGISPAEVVVQNIPQHGSSTQKISISRGNPSKSEKAQISLSGPAARYIELPQPPLVDLPQGQQITP